MSPDDEDKLRETIPGNESGLGVCSGYGDRLAVMFWTLDDIRCILERGHYDDGWECPIKGGGDRYLVVSFDEYGNFDVDPKTTLEEARKRVKDYCESNMSVEEWDRERQKKKANADRARARRRPPRLTR